MRMTWTLVRHLAASQPGETALPDRGRRLWTPAAGDPADTSRNRRVHHHGVPDDTTPARTDNAPGADAATPTVPKRLVFRVPGTAYIAVLFFAMCASSVALVSRWFALVYLIPLGIAYWIMRTRTEVDAERIVVRRLFSSTTIPWSAVKSLRLPPRGWVRAVRADNDGEIALPTVRTRHLPALALISGGRITDPTG
jgi:hypothetical protein